MLSPFDRCLEQRQRPNDRPMHRIIRRIATQDFVNALIQGHRLAGWPGGHVGEGERVHDRPVLDWEGGQLVLQLTLLGCALVPVMVILYDAGTMQLLKLLVNGSCRERDEWAQDGGNGAQGRVESGGLFGAARQDGR